MTWDADEDYSALAQKADRAASVAQSPNAKRYWQRIAEEYRARETKNQTPSRPACAVVAIRCPSAVRENERETALYRLDLKSRTGVVVGRADFDAPDELESFVVAAAVFGACSDIASGYELWNRSTMLLASDKPSVSVKGTDLNAYQRQLIIDTELALYDSSSQIGQSRKLLREIEKLSAASGRDPVWPSVWPSPPHNGSSLKR